jgi:ubiquitin carboxyl-terminal hydrolase 7
VSVTFKDRNQPKSGKEVHLAMSKKATYDTITRLLAKAIRLDNHLCIRLSTTPAASPGPQFVKRLSTMTLHEFLIGASSNNVLFYEILDIPITELDTKRFIHAMFLDVDLKDQVKLSRDNEIGTS